MPFRCSQLMNFMNISFNKSAYIYYNKCLSCRNLGWVWTKLRHNISFPSFNLPVKSFMTHPINIGFNKFGIWLLGYNIDFSYLCIPQAHYFISTCGCEVQMNTCFFDSGSKSTIKKKKHFWFIRRRRPHVLLFCSLKHGLTKWVYDSFLFS